MTDPNLKPGAVIELNDGRIGTVRFVGETSFRPGKWVGVELEDATGKNDGSVQGKRYFECEAGYGMFLQPAGVSRIVEPAPKAPPRANGRPPSTAAKGRTASVAEASRSRPSSRPSSMTSESRATSGTTSPTKRPPPSASRTRTSMAPPPARRTSTVSNSGRTPTPSSTTRATSRPSIAGTPRTTSNSSSATTTAKTTTRPSAAPAKKTTPPPAQTTKRAPSLSAQSTPSVASRSNAAHEKEIEELQTKIRVLEKKRIEDREKMTALERAEQERDRYKTVIEKLQAKYQPQQQENAELKKQLKEAEMALQQVEAIQAEHDSIMEMATLDREVAEEQAEAFKTELETLKVRLEELELENEILKEENEELGKDMSPEERTSQGWLQMERENERLRQALLRLRDLTQEQEAELKDQIRSLEEDVQDLGTVKHQYDDTKAKLLECEADIEDLRQQLDAALGAEEIIEELTEKNLTLNEQIEDLKLAVDDLQSLKELNDELELNHVDNEKQLQEIIDFKDSLLAEQTRRSAQQEETLLDQEYTITRFRELVTNMQSDLEDLRSSKEISETEARQINEKSRAMFDLNRQLQASATSTLIKTIDMELRKLEAQEAMEHLAIVQLFLPEAFHSEREAILALLRFKRIGFKANLLHGFIKDRIADTDRPTQDSVFSACDVLDKLTWIAAMCDRFVNRISGCPLEQFTKFSGALYELEPVERYLSRYIENLKRDELKEKEVSDELHRSIAVMSDLAEHHLGTDLSSYADDLLMRSMLMQSHLETTASALAAIKSEIPSKIAPVTDDEGEDDVARFEQQAETAITQSRSAKVIVGKAVRSLQELKARSLTLNQTSNKEFNEALLAAEELAEYARKLGENVFAIIHEESRTEPLTFNDLKSTILGTANTVFSTKAHPVNETDPFSTMLARLSALTPSLVELSAFVGDLDNTFEFEKPTPPWVLRSKELAAAKVVSVDAEEEIRRLKEDIQAGKRELRTKIQDLEERDVKIEVLEKRVGDAAKKASRIKELEGITKENRETITRMQQSLQEKLDETERLMAERDRAVAAADEYLKRTGDPNAKKGEVEMSGASKREVERLKSEIGVLERTNKFLRETNRREQRARDAAADSWLRAPLTRSFGPPPSSKRSSGVPSDQGVSDPRLALADLTNLPHAARLVDLTTLLQDGEGGEEKSKRRLKWQPKKLTPQYVLEEQEGRWAEIWGSWEARGWGAAGPVGVMG